ncbi:MAG TPA: hypothetical protein VJT33_08400 [bacterium]|nr:hypothetical protein [bacterium]
MTANALPRWAAAFALAAFLTAVPSVPGAAQPVPAALPAPLVPVSVTGGPATLDTLRLAITTAARLALGVQPSSLVHLGQTSPALIPLDASAVETVIAGLTVQAPGMPPSIRFARFALTNAIIPWNDAEILLVSNSPETIPFGKILYTGSLSAAQTVRLLFHHQNGSKSEHMFITVTLSNPARDPISMWVQGAVGAPSQEEVTPGHDAARIFLDDYAHHAGFLVRLPGNSTVPLFVEDLPPLGITSGIAQFSLLEGDKVNVQVVARLASEPDPSVMSFAPDFDRVHQRGAFLRPQIGRTLSYTAGGPPVMMVLAAEADLLHEGQTGALLQGNYGVVYQFTVDVSNPTESPAAAQLVLHADGGQARGTFVIGDQIVESRLVQPNAPQAVATFPLRPQTHRTIRILTIPESGSNYPVRLTLGAP